MRYDSRCRMVVVPAVVLTFVTAGALAEVPPRSAGGQALVVPEEHLDLGEVYHVTPGAGTQLMWTSEAPLMRVTATCNRVVGYVVAPFDMDEGQAPLLAGALRIPAASLSTGSAQYDREFHGPEALRAAEYPEITICIKSVSDVKLIGEENGRKSHTLNVTGEFTVKDTTTAVEMPMRLTLVPFTWQTMNVTLGDFLVLRAQFDVKAEGLGLEPPNERNRDFRAEAIRFDVYLLCSTVSPERNIDPSIKTEHYLRQLQFLTLLRDFKDVERAYELGRKYMREIWDDAQALNRLVTAVLTEEGIETRDLAFALKAARRANELAELKDPGLLDTLAQVYYQRGDAESALKWIRQAEEHLEGAAPPVADGIRATRERYEAQAERNRE